MRQKKPSNNQPQTTTEQVAEQAPEQVAEEQAQTSPVEPVTTAGEENAEENESATATQPAPVVWQGHTIEAGRVRVTVSDFRGGIEEFALIDKHLQEIPTWRGGYGEGNRQNSAVAGD